MMNDEMEQFEQRLSRQPLREIPHEWRGEVLSAAHGAQTAGHLSLITRRSLLSTINHQLSTIFWPHPKAWAGLAAVWILIIAVNVSLRDNSARVAEKCAPPSPEMLVELRQQQRLLAELIGSRDMPEADRPRNVAPKPSGARVEFLTT